MSKLITDIYTLEGTVDDDVNEYFLEVQAKLAAYETLEEAAVKTTGNTLYALLKNYRNQFAYTPEELQLLYYTMYDESQCRKDYGDDVLNFLHWLDTRFTH